MRILLYIIFLSISINAQSDQKIFFRPYNLDFEIGSKFSTPVGWTMNAPGHRDGYSVFADDEVFTSGTQSIILFNYDEQKEDKLASVYQQINAYPYRGRKLKIQFDVKSDFQSSNSAASVYYQEFITTNKEGSSDFMLFNTNNEWQTVSLEYQVDKSALNFRLGFTLNRIGSIWIDNIRIQFLDSTNYQIVESIDDLNTKEILNFSEVYSAIRNYYPHENFNEINWEGFLRNSLLTINTNNNYEESLSEILKQIGSDFNIVDSNKSNKYLRSDFEKGVAVCNKHLGARSTFSSGYSKSSLKNIYDSDRSREAAIMQHVNVTGSGGKRFKWSAKVKVESFNQASQAQLWTRVITEDGREMNLYMYENPITSSKWKRYEVDTILPDKATRATIGLVFFGEGSVYFDDIDFIVHADEEFMDKYLVQNASFDNFNELGQPEDWIFPRSVDIAGYYTKKINENGNNYLKVFSNNTYRIQYPKKGEIYQIPFNNKLIEIPICKNTKNGRLQNNNKENIDFNNVRLDVRDAYSRIAILIEVYSYLYEFASVNNKELYKLLRENINKASQEMDRNEFEDLLKSMYYLTNDSQAKLWSEENLKDYSIPLSWDFLNGQLIVSISKDPNVQVGDTILKINSEGLNEIIDRKINYQAGVNGTLKYLRILEEIKLGENSSKMEISTNNGNFQVVRNIPYQKVLNRYKPDFSQINDSTLYINMSKVDDKYFKELIIQNQNKRAFIFDTRGNVLMSEHFLGYFVQENIKSNNYSIPVYTAPGLKSKINLPSTIFKREFFVDAKLYFICDETTTGYGEAILHTVKRENLGQIIGTYTAGMPAEPEPFSLPGGFNFTMTVTETYSPNNELLNGVMVIPDILIDDSPIYLNKNFDGQIQKAIDLIKNN